MCGGGGGGGGAREARGLGRRARARPWYVLRVGVGWEPTSLDGRSFCVVWSDWWGGGGRL